MMSLIKLSHLLEIHNNSCDEESVGIFALSSTLADRREE